MKLLEPGHPDRDGLNEPEVIQWLTDCEAYDLMAAAGLVTP